MSRDQRDPVVAYLNAHFRPDAAADLLAAAQPLMAIAWDEGYHAGDYQHPRTNPYRSQALRIALESVKAEVDRTQADFALRPDSPTKDAGKA